MAAQSSIRGRATLAHPFHPGAALSSPALVLWRRTALMGLGVHHRRLWLLSCAVLFIYTCCCFFHVSLLLLLSREGVLFSTVSCTLFLTVFHEWWKRCSFDRETGTSDSGDNPGTHQKSPCQPPANMSSETLATLG
jgi:hypothetical protein